ncbi:hypothetical protein [Agreia sp. VKM Ac-1783]|jgi:hypothetical protein|uniref:hypothetical protein n=1 Tax=Agreia sp. VKM Ac-1783 TaxID=1938889 RepID=UPI000A2AA5EC|nr:hypothetical protein [Agreia sp. VKM Ac-1783]SMQ70912.1 hypothetical protein SAMN06295943_2067 [Agreia sp. VKM Ac-1783]
MNRTPAAASSNPLASTALVAGCGSALFALLALFSGFGTIAGAFAVLQGIAAVIFGLRALRLAARGAAGTAQARIGTILGTAGIIVPLVLVFIATRMV